MTKEIDAVSKRLEEIGRSSTIVRRARTMPGIGPIGAMAIKAFAPDLKLFAKGRDFAAWLGLVPRQHSTGGKARLGRVSKAGQKDIRRLLIIGAMSRIASANPDYSPGG